MGACVAIQFGRRRRRRLPARQVASLAGLELVGFLALGVPLLSLPFHPLRAAVMLAPLAPAASR
jgi:hypothetical protein